MKGVILSIFVLSGLGQIYAQDTIYIRKGQWVDKVDAEGYAVLNREKKNVIHVAFHDLNGRLRADGQYSTYKKNRAVRDGKYRVYHPDGRDSLVSMYKDNKLHGTFSSYYKSGKPYIISEYKEGSIQSLLQYYENEAVKREETYFYKDNREKTGMQGHLYDMDGNELDFIPYWEAPQFIPGGNKTLHLILSQRIRYPGSMQRAKIQGRVIVSCAIETNGEMTDIKVVKGVNKTLDQEALRVLQEIADEYEFSPGKQEGIPKRMRITIPVNFRLSKKN